MAVRRSTLWRVPVFCAVAGWVSWYATIWLGRYFYVVTEMGADGTPIVSADPVRSGIFSIVLFILLLLAGGLWFLRGMTRKEIAVSAGIASAMYLLLLLGQMLLPELLGFAVIGISMIQNWTVMGTNWLWRLVGSASSWMSVLMPFLFVPFGRRAESEA